MSELQDGKGSLRGIQEKINKWVKKDDRIVVAMTGPVEDNTHENGDVWEDNNGKKWTVKNGIKQTVSKIDNARMPWWCPKCSKTMKHKNDDKMWYLYGVCFDCVVKYETQLQIDGKFQIYEQKKVLANQVSATKYFIEQTREALRYLIEKPDSEQVLSDGTIQSWVMPNAGKMKEDMVNDLEKAETHLIAIQTLYDEAYKKYVEMGIKEINEK